jgi:hypothetical protein
MKFCQLRYFAAVSAALMAVTFGSLRAQGARPIPPELPEARPDTAVTEVDKEISIDVLANDLGVPPPGQPVPEMRVEGAPACATVRINGRELVFRGSDSCVGSDVVFGYSVKLGGEWQTAAISVTVRPRSARTPPASCNLPDTDWQMTRIDGGVFDKSAVPSGVSDFAGLIEESSFTVDPFCITVEPIPAEPVERYFNNLNEDERRSQFPEFGGGVSTGHAPANASAAMAVAFTKRVAERSGRQLALPTLQQMVAAAWELQSKHPGAPQTDAFLILMRSGNLQWTSSACGPQDRYLAIGPSAQANIQGQLVKLCYNASRIDRTSFHLVMTQ